MSDSPTRAEEAREAGPPPDVWNLGRRWVIRQYRATQPRAELERKARKARGRYSTYTVEESDLHAQAMAISDLRIDAMFPPTKLPIASCHLCHAFSRPGEPVTEHKRGCSYGPVRQALNAFYRRRLSACPDFRRWPMPAPYARGGADAP